MHSNWFNIDYLQQGTRRQRAAYKMLTNLRIFDVLRDFSPVLVGTIPINIDIPDSDLDVICRVKSAEPFISIVQTAFGQHKGFQIKQDLTIGLPVVVNFAAEDFPIEVYADDCPVTEQNAYVHMVVEHRLLCLAGESVRTAIRKLKRDGLKTEPAFARYFNLTGDPFDRLLELAKLDDTALKEAVGLVR